MKRSCKQVDIENWQVIFPWVYDCISRHKRKKDFRRLLINTGQMTMQEYRKALKEKDHAPFERASQYIAQEAAKRISDCSLSLPPVEIRNMIDKSSGKKRQIGKESAIQQVFDYIAKHSCQDIWRRRIVPQQVSSIKGKGQTFGVNMIQKWVEDDNAAYKWAQKHGQRYSRKCKYYVKLDVTKCFPSMRLEVFLRFFSRDCGNRAILWLWEQLLRSHKVEGYEGFMIGALPSESAAQYLMSFLFRYAMSLHKERRGKQTKLITHALYFMDDQIYFGSSRRDLKTAVRQIIRYARDELGITIKPNWQICCIDDTPLDTMGFAIHADAVITVRPRIFIRARRMILRFLRTKRMTIEQARRLCSYKGYFCPNPHKSRKRHIYLNLRTRKIERRLQLERVFRIAAKVVSDYERSHK